MNIDLLEPPDISSPQKMLGPILVIFLWALPVEPLSINKTEHVVKWSGYSDQAALERHLKDLARAAPDIASTFSLGQSEQVLH